MGELAGDNGRRGGAALRLINIPQGFVGTTYGLFMNYLLGRRQLLPIGLYRKKRENPAWRLNYVVTNPSSQEIIAESDQVYVLTPANN